MKREQRLQQQDKLSLPLENLGEADALDRDRLVDDDVSEAETERRGAAGPEKEVGTKSGRQTKSAAEDSLEPTEGEPEVPYIMPTQENEND